MVKDTFTGSEVPLANGRVYHLNATENDIANSIILVGDPHRSDLVASKFAPGSQFAKIENREFTTRSGFYKGVPITVIGTGIGPDNTEIALTEVHVLKAYDVEEGEWKLDYEPLTVIRGGTCGSPQGDVAVGSLGVTRYAIGIDNVAQFHRRQRMDSAERDILNQLKRTRLGKVQPYVARSSQDVADALMEAAAETGAFYIDGITTSAPGFYAPQGRDIPGMQAKFPDMQEILSKIRININGHTYMAVTNEMESSVINLYGRILGWNTGAVCLVVANRNTGEFLDKEQYAEGEERCVTACLEAIVLLDKR